MFATKEKPWYSEPIETMHNVIYSYMIRWTDSSLLETMWLQAIDSDFVHYYGPHQTLSIGKIILIITMLLNIQAAIAAILVQGELYPLRID